MEMNSREDIDVLLKNNKIRKDEIDISVFDIFENDEYPAISNIKKRKRKEAISPNNNDKRKKCEKDNVIPARDSSTEIYCVCRKPDTGDEMVLCDGKKCRYGWFHFSCVGLPPKWKSEKNWYCAGCRSDQK